jgi:hypothetical protein
MRWLQAELEKDRIEYEETVVRLHAKHMEHVRDVKAMIDAQRHKLEAMYQPSRGNVRPPTGRPTRSPPPRGTYDNADTVLSPSLHPHSAPPTAQHHGHRYAASELYARGYDHDVIAANITSRRHIDALPPNHAAGYYSEPRTSAGSLLALKHEIQALDSALKRKNEIIATLTRELSASF